MKNQIIILKGVSITLVRVENGIIEYNLIQNPDLGMIVIGGQWTQCIPWRLEAAGDVPARESWSIIKLSGYSSTYDKIKKLIILDHTLVSRAIFIRENTNYKSVFLRYVMAFKNTVWYREGTVYITNYIKFFLIICRDLYEVHFWYFRNK